MHKVASGFSIFLSPPPLFFFLNVLIRVTKNLCPKISLTDHTIFGTGGLDNHPQKRNKELHQNNWEL